MANWLKMDKHNALLGLARQGWSFRRIGAELGIDRGTVARHVRAANAAISIAGSDPPDPNATISIAGSSPPDSHGAGSSAALPGSVAQLAGLGGSGPPDPNAAISIPGSAGRRSRCEPFRELIQTKLELGLTAQRLWQDLKTEHGFDGSYQSVQRFVRALRSTTPLPFRRMESAPGQEAQVDFGRGAPIIAPDGKRKCPHVFRIVLSCSRKAYSEAVERQTAENFIRCLENAFWHFGGVPRTLVIDNLKAGVIKADWFDPELNPKLQAFAEYYGTVIMPTKPYTPRHKGKVERGVDYVQENALKGHTFDSLAAQNDFLTEWETSVADTRIHGTTRQQVSKRFAELEQPALLPLPAGRFPFFHEAQRCVNRDGHVEVAKAYYSVPPEFLGRQVWARWDGHVVRIFDQQLRQIAIHAQHEPGRFATADQHIPAAKRSGVERGMVWWLRKAHAIGPEAGRWADSVLQQRGLQALRVLMGLVSLTKRHGDAEIEQAAGVAHSHAAWRLRDIRNLLKRQMPPQEQFEFTQEHPLIRSLADYAALVRVAFGTADSCDWLTGQNEPRAEEVQYMIADRSPGRTDAAERLPRTLEGEPEYPGSPSNSPSFLLPLRREARRPTP